MTIQIQLTPAIESGLGSLARRKGVSLNEYLQDLLESLAIPGLAATGGTTPDQRADAFRDWARHFPYRRDSPIPDEALHRENIYRPAA
jgi:hypothetical protein